MSVESLGLDAFDSDLSGVDVGIPDMPDAEAPPAEDTPTPVDETLQASGDGETEETKEEEQPGEEGTDKEKAAAVVAAAVKAKEGAPAPKILKLKTESGLVDLSEAAEVDWKVDGKVEKVKLRELLDNYAGKTSYDRKFQELATQRKGFQEESTSFERSRERHKTLIQDMHKATSEGRVFEAVASMLEMTGLDSKVDAKKYVSELREALVKHAQALAGMTPEQRRIAELQEEQAHQTSKLTRLTQQREQEQAERAYHDRVTKAIDSVGSTPAEFVQTRDFMVDFYKRQGQDPAQVTPEVIAQQIRDVRDFSLVKRAMESVDPELSKNQQLWKWAVETFRANPKWTEDDVKEVFQKSVGAKRSKAISQKIAKQPTATIAKAAIKGKTVSKQSDAEDFSSFSEADLTW